MTDATRLRVYADQVQRGEPMDNLAIIELRLIADRLEALERELTTLRGRTLDPQGYGRPR